MSILFLVITVTLAISAICSLLEATLYSTRLVTLEAMKAEGRHVGAASQMLALKRNVHQPTSAILILNTVANTAGATMAGMLAAQHWGPGAVPVFSAALTGGILFFSEILPKTIGAVHWRGIWPLVAWPLKGLVTLMRPLIWMTDHVASIILSPGRKTPVTTEAEIVALIRMGSLAGQLTRTETELLTAVFHFDEMVSSDVMTPWNSVTKIDASWSRDRCREFMREASFSRYPVCDASGEVLGVLHATDFASADEGTDIVSLLRPIMKVPESLGVSALLRRMQREGRQVAVIVDEYGNTTGFVTIVDVIEEIVGVLGDEETPGEPDLKITDPGVYSVSGVTPVARVRRELGLDLEGQPHARTISGWLAEKLGRLPKVGDEVVVPGGKIKVERVVSHRADRVRIVVDQADGPDDPEGTT